LDAHSASLLNHDVTTTFLESGRLLGVGWGSLDEYAFCAAVILKGLSQSSFPVQTVNIYLQPVLSVDSGFKILYTLKGRALLSHGHYGDQPCELALKYFRNLMSIVRRGKKE
jgi:hypothetical protein